VHRGNHGYLPNGPSEQGWLILDDASLSPRRAGAQLIDIAPTLLSLVGMTPPPYMRGVPIFGLT
jgi:bisphosphoglycerate-independent phosphoglycerate mutase (AlkP superfamily)